MKTTEHFFLTQERPYDEWQFCFVVPESRARRAIELPEFSNDIVIHGDHFIHDRTLLYPNNIERYKTASIIGIAALGEQTSLTSIRINLPGIFKRTMANLIKKEPNAMIYIENIPNSEQNIS